jgi:hypothetical protein
MHPLWLPAGKRPSVRNASTEFDGVVSYTMDRSWNGKKNCAGCHEPEASSAKSLSGVGRLYTAQQDSVAFQGAKNKLEIEFT